MIYRSTKTYTHAQGLSCCFRQHRAQSHCQFLHGYALEVRIEFESDILDKNNWVIDFGGVSEVKNMLTHMFDHTTLVAEDDPQLEHFKHLESRGLIQLRVMHTVSCEAFAAFIFNWVSIWLAKYPAVTLRMVEVREHASNSAIAVNG